MPKSVSREQPDTQVVPEPALEKRTRRSFSAEDKPEDDMFSNQLNLFDY